MREIALATLGYALNSRDNVRHALQPHFRASVSDDRVEEVFLVCASPDNWRAMVDLVRDEIGIAGSAEEFLFGGEVGLGVLEEPREDQVHLGHRQMCTYWILIHWSCEYCTPGH